MSIEEIKNGEQLDSVRSKLNQAIDGVNNMPDGSVSTVYAEDVKAVTQTGSYYADGSSSNRPLGLNGTFFFTHVDQNTASIQYITSEGSRAFFAGKLGGAWQPWMELSLTEIMENGWPTLGNDNLIYEEDTGTVSGWSSSTSTLTSDGTWQTFTPNGIDPGNITKSITGPTTGDYIFYVTLRADSLVEDNVFNVGFGDVGSEAFIISLGYDREASVYEQNRISAKVGTVGVAGPVIDYSAQDVEIAIHYDGRVGVGNLYLRESGAWRWYGAAAISSPYKSTIRYGSGGDCDMTANIKEMFVAKPNVVAIGDSITAGHNAFDPDPAFYAGDDDYDSTWMAHAQIYGSVRNNLIVNYGVGGENTGEIANRVQAMLDNTSPSVVFLSACNNDYGDSISLSQRTNNIQSSVDALTNAGVAVALYNAIYPNDSAASFPAQRDYYKNWWDNYRSSITGVNLAIDINEAVKDPNGGGEIDAAYTADGVHPNVAGYTLIGDHIESQES